MSIGLSSLHFRAVDSSRAANHKVLLAFEVFDHLICPKGKTRSIIVVATFYIFSFHSTRDQSFYYTGIHWFFVASCVVTDNNKLAERDVDNDLPH